MRLARNHPRIVRKKAKGARSPVQTIKLYELALAKAEASRDHRLTILREARPHQRAKLLRDLGIITEVDVEREFGK